VIATSNVVGAPTNQRVITKTSHLGPDCKEHRVRSTEIPSKSIRTPECPVAPHDARFTNVPVRRRTEFESGSGWSSVSRDAPLDPTMGAENAQQQRAGLPQPIRIISIC
jgi:hypothetical protein